MTPRDKKDFIIKYDVGDESYLDECFSWRDFAEELAFSNKIADFDLFIGYFSDVYDSPDTASEEALDFINHIHYLLVKELTKPFKFEDFL